MIQTSQTNDNFYPLYDDYEHDDYMTAEDYERRQYERDGWNESRYDRQRYWFWWQKDSLSSHLIKWKQFSWFSLLLLYSHQEFATLPPQHFTL